MASANLTAARLRELLDYDSATGIFRRRKNVGNTKAGAVAGNLDPSGYVRIGVDGGRYWAHRLAWLHVHGEWAPEDVDHLDRVRNHNWIANLRPASRAENLQNQILPGSGNVSGFRGVAWDSRRKRWKATISVKNKNIALGRFDSVIEARDAYLQAKRVYHVGAPCN